MQLGLALLLFPAGRYFGNLAFHANGHNFAFGCACRAEVMLFLVVQSGQLNTAFNAFHSSWPFVWIWKELSGASADLRVKKIPSAGHNLNYAQRTRISRGTTFVAR